jgi:hypothetical protein
VGNLGGRCAAREAAGEEVPNLPEAEIGGGGRRGGVPPQATHGALR